MERYIWIHGHSYQSPRGKPWLEEVELQDAAHPFHDWNARITAERYAPNPASRILNSENRIADLINSAPRTRSNLELTKRLISLMMVDKEVGKMKAERRVKAKKVTFSLEAPEAAHVYLAGDFNGWNTASHPLKKDKTGVWKVSVNLVPGIYEYLFFVEGGWQGDPQATECVANPFGAYNCVRRVG